jgi:hypothetical protein
MFECLVSPDEDDIINNDTIELRATYQHLLTEIRVIESTSGTEARRQKEASSSSPSKVITE